jgi:hypothetical protein
MGMCCVGMMGLCCRWLVLRSWLLLWVRDAVLFTSGKSAPKQGLTPNPATAPSASGLSKPSRPTASRPGGLPVVDHSALLGRTPSAKDRSTPATPGNVFDRLSHRYP